MQKNKIYRGVTIFYKIFNTMCRDLTSLRFDIIYMMRVRSSTKMRKVYLRDGLCRGRLFGMTAAKTYLCARMLTLPTLMVKSSHVLSA